MLSTEYRLKLEFICSRIEQSQPVELSEMIWAEKLAKANTHASEMLKKARRRASNPNPNEGGLDEFLDIMNLGDPDPSNHRTSFDGADDIADWFKQDKPDDWRRRD